MCEHFSLVLYSLYWVYFPYFIMQYHSCLQECVSHYMAETIKQIEVVLFEHSHPTALYFWVTPPLQKCGKSIEKLQPLSHWYRPCKGRTNWSCTLEGTDIHKSCWLSLQLHAETKPFLYKSLVFMHCFGWVQSISRPMVNWLSYAKKKP